MAGKAAFKPPMTVQPTGFFRDWRGTIVIIFSSPARPLISPTRMNLCPSSYII